MSIGFPVRRASRLWPVLGTLAASLLWLASESGCSTGSAGASVRMELLIRDDQGQPLAHVPIEIEGTATAVSDAAGRASITLEARGRVRVSATCPEGYRSPEPRSVPLGARGGPSALELELSCKPTLRSLLVVVRAQRAGAAPPSGLALSANGEPLGVVAEDGTLHATLQRAPDTELRLMLDTSTNPQLVPRSPVRELKVMDRDEIVVFDQRFEVEAPRKRRTSGVAKREKEPKHIPYAISGRSHY